MRRAIFAGDRVFFPSTIPEREENTSSLMAPSCILLIFITVLRSERVLATCVERDDQIQRYLISIEPPYDNYYNISKAVYPSVDLPSMLIKITVTFLPSGDNVTQRGSFPSNRSTTNMNIIKQNGSNSRTTTKKEYTWSASCLYVSGGNISLTSMNVFSLWAIYPNRRERKLHLTLPELCRDASTDAMIYFLSTVGIYWCCPQAPQAQDERRRSSCKTEPLLSGVLCDKALDL